MLLCLLGALFVYQVSLGTYTWTYIAEVGNEKNQALGSVFLWGVIQSLVVNYLFDYLGDAGTFWMYGGFSVVTGILVLIFMRETQGLTQEQTKLLYVPDRLRVRVQNVSTIEDPRQKPGYDKTIANTITRSTLLHDADSPLVDSKE